MYTSLFCNIIMNGMSLIFVFGFQVFLHEDGQKRRAHFALYSYACTIVIFYKSNFKKILVFKWYGGHNIIRAQQKCDL
jgi:hypothetical protein